MTTANNLREALARVVSDQRRDADELVKDILAVLHEYSREGWLVAEGYIYWNKGSWIKKSDEHVLVLTMPDKEPS